MAVQTPERIRLGIGDASVPLHVHIAHFIESDRDFSESLGFLEEGLRGTDHCILFGHLRAHELTRENLEARGFDTAKLVAQGRLAFIGAAATGDAIFETIASVYAEMTAAGAAVIRHLGCVGWLEPGWPSVANLLTMEAKVAVEAEKYPCVILCLYDLRTLPSTVLRHGAMELHPFLLRGSQLRENPLVLPAEAALEQIEARSEALLDLERKREALQLYQKMFANMRDPLMIVALDPDKGDPLVVEMNLAAQGISRCAQPAGRTLGDCFPGLIEAGFSASCCQMAGTGGSVELGELAAAGRFYAVKVFCLFDNYLGIALYDTTERKLTESSLLSLRKLSATLQSTLEIENILDELVNAATGIVGAESGVAAICISEELSCYRYLVRGVPQAESWQPGVAQAESWQPGQPAPGRVIMQRGPQICNDTLRDPQVNRQNAERYGVRSALSTPILDVSGKMLGFLEIHNKSGGGEFTRLDQDQLASAAQIAALAVRNASAFRKITQMGARLRESTERYRHLVEGLDAVVWEAEPVTIRFSFVSRRAEAILGYPISQWLEEPDFWANHLHPEDRERAVRSCLRATAEAKDHRFVYRAVAADGRTVWLRDHVRMELDAQGKVRQLRGVMVDITEAMTTQDSLRKSEATFRSTFEGAGIGMALVDVEGRIVEANPALQALLGYSSEELAGRTFASFCHDCDAQIDGEQFRELMAGRLTRYQVEKRLLARGGAEIWGRVTLSAIRVDGGTHYAIAMVEDISERKKAEGEVAQLLARVQQDAARLEERVAERTSQLQEINAELDSFAHSVSHDLRAPLRAMQGYVEILLEDGSLAESERLEYLKRVMSATQGMERLIQDLLAYSRLSRQEIMLKSVSLDAVVRSAAEQLELASGGKQYELEIDGELPEVIGHQAVLVQVVLNLMTNGIKFVPRGVTPKLRIWAEQRDGSCRLFVEDNGIGIAREHQERIFKIFERLHGIDAYPGTGVGLAIVRKAVLRLGGEIGVESREGEGSRFWVELPRPQAEPPPTP